LADEEALKTGGMFEGNDGEPEYEDRLVCLERYFCFRKRKGNH
jgi:hypothetical protein